MEPPPARSATQWREQTLRAFDLLDSRFRGLLTKLSLRYSTGGTHRPVPGETVENVNRGGEGSDPQVTPGYHSDTWSDRRTAATWCQTEET